MSTDFMNIDGNIKRVQKETLTPYKIATIILIKEYCNETTKGNLIEVIKPCDRKICNRKSVRRVIEDIFIHTYDFI